MKAVIKVLLVLVALGVAVFALVGTANAADVKVEIVAPTGAVVGHPVDIRATLHRAGDGSALAGVPVTLYTEASFGGVTGEAELANALPASEKPTLVMSSKRPLSISRKP